MASMRSWLSLVITPRLHALLASGHLEDVDVHAGPGPPPRWRRRPGRRRRDPGSRRHEQKDLLDERLRTNQVKGLTALEEQFIGSGTKIVNW